MKTTVIKISNNFYKIKGPAVRVLREAKKVTWPVRGKLQS